MKQPRWYQTEAVESLYKYWSESKGNPCIALPTGTGKSLVIAMFVHSIMSQWSNQRVLLLTHVKKLIENNAQTLLDYWPGAPIGIYSAGLGRRDVALPIIYGGVASVVRALDLIGRFDLVGIDEGHMINPDEASMYSQIFAVLKQRNPKLKIFMLTATPFRLGQGLITDPILRDGKRIEPICTDICYDLTSMDNFNRLVYEGYLSPLTSKATATEYDFSAVKMSAGDLNQKQAQASAMEQRDVTWRALCEYVSTWRAEKRTTGLIFASGIAHAEQINMLLNDHLGVKSTIAHSKLGDKQCDENIEAYMRGEFENLVNYNMFTTGMDLPRIDIGAILRKTMSPNLWVQILGRFTRPCVETSKINARIMDYAGNTKTLGPVNDPHIPRQKGKSTGDLPIKICEACGEYNHPRVNVCCACGAPFDFKEHIKPQAATIDVMKYEAPVIEWKNVTSVIYRLHEKPGSPPMLLVKYFCGIEEFREYVLFEHKSMRYKACDWWRARHESEPPETTEQALSMTSRLRVPRRIRIHANKQYPDILGQEW